MHLQLLTGPRPQYTQTRYVWTLHCTWRRVCNLCPKYVISCGRIFIKMKCLSLIWVWPLYCTSKIYLNLRETLLDLALLIDGKGGSRNFLNEQTVLRFYGSMTLVSTIRRCQLTMLRKRWFSLSRQEVTTRDIFNLNPLEGERRSHRRRDSLKHLTFSDFISVKKYNL